MCVYAFSVFHASSRVWCYDVTKPRGYPFLYASTDRASVVKLLVFNNLALLLCFAVIKLNSLPIPLQIESFLFSIT